MPTIAAKCVYEVDFIVERSSVSMFGKMFSFFSSLTLTVAPHIDRKMEIYIQFNAFRSTWARFISQIGNLTFSHICFAQKITQYADSNANKLEATREYTLKK